LESSDVLVSLVDNPCDPGKARLQKMVDRTMSWLQRTLNKKVSLFYMFTCLR
jgi:queuine tRNA-ribosyltransferase subunit QTRTD1